MIIDDETPQGDEDELLLTDEVQEEDGQQDEEQSDDQQQEGEEEEVIGFGDDVADPQEGDSNLVKHLRTTLKETQARLAEAQKSAKPAEAIEVGEKPTLESCGYDEEEFDKQYEAWRERRDAAAREETERNKAAETQTEEWNTELRRVETELTALGRPDVEDARDTVRAALTKDQQSLLVLATKKNGMTGKMIYALGQNPTKLAALAAATNPVEFIEELVELKGKLTVTKRRKAPDPEQIERGSARVSHMPANKQLEKLEKEADRTGDRTKLIAFKAQQKKAANQK